MTGLADNILSARLPAKHSLTGKTCKLLRFDYLPSYLLTRPVVINHQ
jgi:hypothetical protein